MNARSLILSAGIFGALLLTGCPAPVEPIVPPNPPRIDRFEVSTLDAAPRQTVTLSWSVSDATSITLEQLGVGALPASGSEGSLEVTLGDRDAVFALVAHGEVGSDSRVLRVNVDAQDPLLVLAAVPAQITAGESSVLVYSGPEGAQLLDEAGAALVTDAAAQGSLAVSPRFDSTYTLKSGDQQAQATVAVAPGIIELRAVHLQGADGRVRITWKAGGGSMLTLEGAGRGELFTSDLREVIAEGSFDDVLPQGLPADAELSYALKVGTGETVAVREVSVRVGGTPNILSFTAPEWSKEGGQLQLQWQIRGGVRAELWEGTTQLFEATNQAEVSAGSFFPRTPAAPTTYELRAFDAYGNIAVAQATTTPVGKTVLVAFDASTTTIAQGGEPVTLSWEVTHARKMRIMAKGKHLVHEAEGVLAEKGSVVVYPNAATVEYVLTADNLVGDSIAPASQTIAVTALSAASTWPEKVPIPYGAPLAEAQIASTQVPNVVGYAGFPNVEKNAAGEAFIDIRGFGVEAPFDATEDTYYESVSLPEAFTVVLFGRRFVDQTQVIISMNGWFALSTSTYGTSGPDSNVYGFPSKALEESAIAPYFADLRMTPEAKIYVAAVGSGDARRVIVQYTDVTLETAPGSRLTFQGQVFASGKVVFAYQKLDGVRDFTPSIGVQDYSMTVGALAPDVPVPGDTYTFFAPTTSPAPYPVAYTGYIGRMMMAGGGFMEFEAKPQVLAKDLVYVSEINPVSTVAGGEWVELTSIATEPINLRGFTFDFGGGQRKRIDTDLVIQPEGQVLLAQTANGGDGLTPDFVFGADVDLPDTTGAVGLVSGAAPYAMFEWAAGDLGGPGVSLRFEKRGAPWVYASTVDGLSCLGSAAYGTHGQLGTPGVPDPGCFPYSLQSSGGSAFEPIALLGQKLTVTQPRGQVFEVNLPFPVRVGHKLSSKVYVSTNGFLTLEETSCGTTTCFSSNSTTPSTTTTTAPYGAVAVFWDAMDHAKNPTAGLYWLARDPDGVPGNGDEYALFSWEGVALYSTTVTSNLNFQGVLTATGDIELRYGGMTASTATLAQGSSATVWVANPQGSAAYKLHSGSISGTNPGISPDTVKLLTWAP